MTRMMACAFMAAALCRAQRPAFEAAAIKPSKAEEGHSHWNSGKGRLTMDNMSLRQIIRAAYSAKEYELEGGPGWLDSERFHIDAKAEGNVDDDQLMPMLQTLLADRFKLVVHRERKELPGLALVVAKGGPKIRAVEGGGSQMNSRDGKLTAKHASMAKLAEFAQRQVGRPVVDKTGLAGGFDFTLQWSNERMLKAAEESGTVPPAPSIFTALPEQLGLKLEARKVPVEILMIDSAERPTEN
jgi:uncharacterized protein (TIGR03435 family)